MKDVTESWLSFLHIDRDSDHARKIEEVLENANFPYLCSKAIELRRAERQHDGQLEPQETLTCSIDTAKFASGTYNVVVGLTFSDERQWVARIRLPQGERDESQDRNEDEGLKMSILSEVSTMNLVRARTSIPVPCVYAFETGPNPFGYSYLFMEALPGRVPDSRMSWSVPDEHKRKVARQLADYFYQLSRIRFSQIGRIYCGPNLDEEPRLLPFAYTEPGTIGPLSTSLDYFYTLRKIQNRAALKDHRGEEEWESACWFLEKALPSMVTEEHIRGPFPLCHLDWHYNNMLFDDEYNITGIIDWSDAQTVPVERFVISPEFVPAPAAFVDNTSIIRFRAMFVEALEEKEKESEGRVSLSKLVGSPLSEVVYRCTYSYPWRAIFDARLVLRLTFGENAKWDDFKKFYVDASAC